MHRAATVAVALAAAFLFLVPAVLAADPAGGRDQVLVAVRGDVTLPADQSAEVIVVVRGVAHIAGDVRTLVVVDGTAILDGATADAIWAVNSDVTLNPGTVVTGDIQTLDATVHRVGDAVVSGEVTDMAGALFAMAMILAPAAILFWIGFGLATLVAGLALAGLAARQVRTAELVISREPLLSGLVGLAGLILVPFVAIVLMVTVVGAPLGLALLLGVWPLLGYVGYLVAGIWIGDWLLAKTQRQTVRERPYLAAVIGLVLLGLVGLVPGVGILSGIAGLLGVGAVIVAGWRVLRGPRATPQSMPGVWPAPVAG